MYEDIRRVQMMGAEGLMAWYHDPLTWKTDDPFAAAVARIREAGGPQAYKRAGLELTPALEAAYAALWPLEQYTTCIVCGIRIHVGSRCAYCGDLT